MSKEDIKQVAFYSFFGAVISLSTIAILLIAVAAATA